MSSLAERGYERSKERGNGGWAREERVTEGRGCWGGKGGRGREVRWEVEGTYQSSLGFRV